MFIFVFLFKLIINYFCFNNQKRKIIHKKKKNKIKKIKNKEKENFV